MARRSSRSHQGPPRGLHMTIFKACCKVLKRMDAETPYPSLKYPAGRLQWRGHELRDCVDQHKLRRVFWFFTSEGRAWLNVLVMHEVSDHWLYDLRILYGRDIMKDVLLHPWLLARIMISAQASHWGQIRSPYPARRFCAELHALAVEHDSGAFSAVKDYLSRAFKLLVVAGGKAYIKDTRHIAYEEAGAQRGAERLRAEIEAREAVRSTSLKSLCICSYRSKLELGENRWIEEMSATL